MLAAVRRRLDAINIVARYPLTGDMGATPTADVYHSVLSMLLAVCRLHALDIEARHPSTRLM